MLRQREHLPMKNKAEDASPEFSDRIQWDRVAGSEDFKDLLQSKKIFIIPVFVFFFVYYFGLAVLVGYAPKLASTHVFGTVTLAYLYALSQFAVAWVVAGFYLLASTRFDARTRDIIARVAMDVVTDKDERQGVD
jgi:uncharacterized membrane protein (DUF485 family)